MRGELARHDGPDQIVLYLTRAELLLLAGSVNEAIEAVDDWEFLSGSARPWQRRRHCAPNSGS
jgi:hypothetical protein